MGCCNVTQVVHVYQPTVGGRPPTLFTEESALFHVNFWKCAHFLEIWQSVWKIHGTITFPVCSYFTVLCSR